MLMMHVACFPAVPCVCALLQMPRAGTYILVQTRPYQDCGLTAENATTLCVGKMMAREGEQQQQQLIPANHLPGVTLMTADGGVVGQMPSTMLKGSRLISANS